MGTGLSQGLSFLPSHTCHPLRSTFELGLSGSSLGGKRAGQEEEPPGKTAQPCCAGESSSTACWKWTSAEGLQSSVLL